MKQIIQDLKNGDTILEEVRTISVKIFKDLIQPNSILVLFRTEKMLFNLGKVNFIQKPCN